MSSDQILSLDQAAELLGIEAGDVHRLIVRGRLRATALPKGDVVLQSYLVEYLKAGAIDLLPPSDGPLADAAEKIEAALWRETRQAIADLGTNDRRLAELQNRQPGAAVLEVAFPLADGIAAVAERHEPPFANAAELLLVHALRGSVGQRAAQAAGLADASPGSVLASRESWAKFKAAAVAELRTLKLTRREAACGKQLRYSIPVGALTDERLEQAVFRAY